MITSTDVTIAEYIIDTAGSVDTLIAGYRSSNRGRPANRVGIRLLLIGLLLSIQHRGKATVEAACDTLLRSISLDDQLRLGVYVTSDDAATGGDALVAAVSVDRFYGYSKALRHGLAYTTESAPDISDEVRSHRHGHVKIYCDDLMDVFAFAFMGSALAVDATGIWSWGRGYKAEGRAFAKERGIPIGNPNDYIGPDLPQFESRIDNDSADPAAADIATDIAAADEEADAMSVAHLAKRRDVDAAWGVKTGKHKREEAFFGFHEHTFVQMGSARDGYASLPSLIRRFELTNAKTDVVEVSLDLLDRMEPIADLAVDRHYSYKQTQRWKDELVLRGIDQHLDLREDDQGFTEFDRLRFAAGHAHCPVTPDDLGVIKRPAPNASEVEFAEFAVRIDRREAFALAIRTGVGEGGTHRATCPALAGKVGCPLRTGTVAVAVNLGLPIVENPPDADRDGEALPKCCTQVTVTVNPPEPVYKLQQKYYWGANHGRSKWGNAAELKGPTASARTRRVRTCDAACSRASGCPGCTPSWVSSTRRTTCGCCGCGANRTRDTDSMSIHCSPPTTPWVSSASPPRNLPASKRGDVQHDAAATSICRQHARAVTASTRVRWRDGRDATTPCNVASHQPASRPAASPEPASGVGR